MGTSMDFHPRRGMENRRCKRETELSLTACESNAVFEQNGSIVITENGEVQTHEEATVYVKELDIFSTMKVLEDTPAVSSLGKLCDEHGY